ncbi:dTDP-4-dehydrorhamnose 3,5-epimerase [bacterium]|nr:dTDP-4-dehydrorhamnose 3,5-epimerase [bacterium]
MIFTETPLKGSYLVSPEKITDERGFFARSWCEKEFRDVGLASRIAQCSISYNRLKGTLRGMHYQVPPFEEDKLVRCTRGAIHDVIIDLRHDSKSFGKHFSVTLTSVNRTMLYIPKGFAHGFLTLENDTEIYYQMSEFYAPDSARGVRWNDPAFSIEWPGNVLILSEKDRSYPDFDTKKAGH